MEIQTVRVGSALIATMLVTPLGAGLANAATAEPDPSVAVTESVDAAAPSVEPEATVAETAPSAPDEPEVTPTAEVGDAAAVPSESTQGSAPSVEGSPDATLTDATDAAVDDATGTVAPATGAAETTAPRAAAAIPVGVLITSIAVEATVSPVQQPWSTTGTYSATLTVDDVVGTGSDSLSYAGLIADTTFTLSVDGGAAITVVPAADGTIPVTGMVEGTNYLVLNAQYANPAAPAVTAAASYYVEATVLTQDETVDLVREDTASTGVNEGTRYQGEQVTVVAPAGTYSPGEVLTVTVYDDTNVAVDTLTAVAAADGSLSVTYTVPTTMTPGDYLLYLSDAAGQPAGSYILHVLERVTEAVTPVQNTVTTTEVKTDPAVSTARSAALVHRLATTGSESSSALWAAGGLAAAGAALVGGAAVLRRRRSVAS